MIGKTTMQVERMNQYFGWGQSAKNQAHVYARDLELDESVHIAKLFNEPNIFWPTDPKPDEIDPFVARRYDFYIKEKIL